MRIDRTHRPWLIGSCVLLALLLCLYIPSAASGRTGGATAIGLFYGVLGFGLILFAAALGVRRRFPIWRIGRAHYWMRGHLWLGALALPVLLLHGGFHLGGWLTTTLLLLLLLVTVSGGIGAYLQHTLPGLMMREVQYETIYDQIDHVRSRLVAEADASMASMTEAMAPGPGAGGTVVLTYIDAVPGLHTELEDFGIFYADEVKPYLENRTRNSPLADAALAAASFERMRGLLPESGRKTLKVIEEICEEKRQLDRQVFLHRCLHGWLLCHVPISMALILLGLVHAIGALHY